MSKIAVVGAGYVGLTTAACFSHLGHDVVCADVDVARVERLRRAATEEGVLPIVEEGLEQLVRDGLRHGRLRFVIGAAAAVAGAEFVYLCVPTPQGDDGSADLSYVESAAAEIGPLLDSESIVVNKSTVPVGSTRIVQRALRRPDVYVVSNPEFLREGSAVHDFLHPGRIVIGADDQAAAIRVASLYLGVAAPLVVTDPRSAEIIKYASNAFLATKVSFVNAVAAICESVGADVNDVVLGMGYDDRIGREFLRPGPGWGGSCLPKDTRALLRIADDAGYRFDLLKATIDVNEQQLDRMVDKLADAVGTPLDGVTVAVWGLTFKARTDDLRDSPALAIVQRLLDRGATVQAYDPTVQSLDGIDVRPDPYAACEGAAVLAVLTEWDELRWLDFDKVASVMASPPRGRHPQPPRPDVARTLGVHLPRGRPRLMARVVVAGGAGFIGSYVCEALVNRGDHVVAIDNLVTGRPDNVAGLLGHERFALVEHDVCQPLERTGALAPRVDLVMDLASPASPDDFDRIPLEILAVGSAGTGHLLDLARADGARFFLASTSEVYGDPLVHPQHESYWGHVDPIGPRSCYDEAKRFAEALTMATAACTAWTCASPASSTPTAPACTPTTAGWSRTSSSRP